MKIVRKEKQECFRILNLKNITTIIDKIYETNSSFHVKYRNTGKL